MIYTLKTLMFNLNIFKVITAVLEGEGVGWLKLNRLKKLMEDESYRNLVLSKLNRTLNKKISPDDHIEDVVSVFLYTILLLNDRFN